VAPRSWKNCKYISHIYFLACFLYMYFIIMKYICQQKNDIHAPVRYKVLLDFSFLSLGGHGGRQMTTGRIMIAKAGLQQDGTIITIEAIKDIMESAEASRKRVWLANDGTELWVRFRLTKDITLSELKNLNHCCSFSVELLDSGSKEIYQRGQQVYFYNEDVNDIFEGIVVIYNGYNDTYYIDYHKPGVSFHGMVKAGYVFLTFEEATDFIKE